MHLPIDRSEKHKNPEAERRENTEGEIRRVHGSMITKKRSLIFV